MNERVGVDALKGAGNGQGAAVGLFAFGNGLGCGQAENGPDPFATAEEAVAHGFDMPSEISSRSQHVLFEVFLDQLALGVKIRSDLHLDPR